MPAASMLIYAIGALMPAGKTGTTCTEGARRTPPDLINAELIPSLLSNSFIFGLLYLEDK